MKSKMKKERKKINFKIQKFVNCKIKIKIKNLNQSNFKKGFHFPNIFQNDINTMIQK